MKQNTFVFFAACYLFLIVQPTFSEPRRAEIVFQVGKAAFLDEDSPFDRVVFAGSFRYFLTSRFALTPEFTYLRGPGTNRDYLIVPNLYFEVASYDKFSVYLIGGAGLIHHREEFGEVSPIAFTSNDWTATGGIGANINLSERIVFIPEFRFGWDPLYRFAAGIGYRF